MEDNQETILPANKFSKTFRNQDQVWPNWVRDIYDL